MEGFQPLKIPTLWVHNQGKQLKKGGSMRDLNPKQFTDDPESSIGRDPHQIILDVQAGGDQAIS